MSTPINVKHLRKIARLFPLKRRLDFLIKKHLEAHEALVIPYYDGYAISITPNSNNRGTISDLIYHGAKYLPEFNLISKIKSRLPKNYTYIDIGSNIGTTVWLFARKSVLSYAIEPIPHLFSTITKSIKINQCSNVVAVMKAMGDTKGVLKMLNNDNSSVTTSDVDGSLDIEVTTLDDEFLNSSSVDFIKIDVEGFEMKVLAGAESTIAKFRPKMLIELHPIFLKQYNEDYRNVIDWLEKHNYSIEYYSFLHELRMGRVKRILSRFTGNTWTRLTGKADFIEYVSRKPELLSYHLYCEPN